MEGKPRVLFVDDEGPIINTLRRAFKNEVFEGLFATSAEEAEAILKKEEISVIVADYRMPQVDGLTLLKLVKERWPDVLRIMLTGYPDLGMLLDAVNDVGIFRIIIKPWRNEELRFAIHQALDHQRLIVENKRLMMQIEKQNKELMNINAKLLELVEEKTREWIEIKEKLIQMDKLFILGFMTSVVAHELNNPLTAIIAITEMALKNKGISTESEIYSDLKEIESAALRCRDIVNRYLKFTRASRGDEQTILSIKDVINNAVNMMSPLLVKKNQKILVELKETPMVRGDFNRLHQVFVNLITNSMDAMGDNGCITIKTEHEDGGVKIVVEDDGPGIPDEIRDKIFTPFFTTKTNGTGLGLSIVDAIIKEHGGRIVAGNKSDRGATFTIYLPGVKEHNAEGQGLNN